MMRFPVFWVPLFADGTEREREFSLAALRVMLEALVQCNVMWIASHRSEFRPIFTTGVKWEPEQGTEDWLSIPEIYKAIAMGKPVDCEDIAAARAAELRLGLGGTRLGPVKAKADIRGRVTGPAGRITMHAFVRYPDSSVEDPSKICGMPGDGAAVWERQYPPKLVSLVQRMKRRAA